MKNIWSTIFARAIVDKDSNALSLIDCVEEITVNFVSAEELSRPQKNIPINFALISLWTDKQSSKNKSFEHVIEIIDPENKKISEFSNKPVFEAGKKRLRTITQINGLTLTVEGEYKIVVKYKMDSDKFITAAELPLDIKFILNAQISKK